MKRIGSVAWNGGLREDKGSVSTESRALETHPYIFSRYGERPETNPGSCLERLMPPVSRRARTQRINAIWHILNHGDWRCRL
jgi:hypothetical protein